MKKIIIPIFIFIAFLLSNYSSLKSMNTENTPSAKIILDYIYPNGSLEDELKSLLTLLKEIDFQKNIQEDIIANLEKINLKIIPKLNKNPELFYINLAKCNKYFQNIFFKITELKESGIKSFTLYFKDFNMRSYNIIEQFKLVCDTLLTQLINLSKTIEIINKQREDSQNALTELEEEDCFYLQKSQFDTLREEPIITIINQKNYEQRLEERYLRSFGINSPESSKQSSSE